MNTADILTALIILAVPTIAVTSAIHWIGMKAWRP
jgi:DUF1365 family protein